MNLQLETLRPDLLGRTGWPEQKATVRTPRLRLDGIVCSEAFVSE
jgi:hypothetical protein